MQTPIEQLRGLRVSRHMRFEGFSLRHRYDSIEWELMIWLGGLEHVGIAVRQHNQAVARLKTCERLGHFREGGSFSISATRWWTSSVVYSMPARSRTKETDRWPISR